MTVESKTQLLSRRLGTIASMGLVARNSDSRLERGQSRRRCLYNRLLLGKPATSMELRITTTADRRKVGQATRPAPDRQPTPLPHVTFTSHPHALSKQHHSSISDSSYGCRNFSLPARLPTQLFRSDHADRQRAQQDPFCRGRRH